MKIKFLIIITFALLMTGLLFLVEYYAEIDPDEHVMHLPETEHHEEHMALPSIQAATDGPYTTFNSSIEGLPEAQPTQTVELQDGDLYNITAGYVKKRIGSRVLRMLAYNGSIPGPLIRAPQGAEITINFKNDTDIEQTIHSHGIRVDNLSDGIPDITQDSVKPGESYTYTIKFHDAGVYWYHPHTREDYGQELGLYGNYLVAPSDPDHWNPVDRGIPLIIDDILIENDRIADFYREFTNFALLGRFGNEFLINGEPDYNLHIEAGEVIRFLITNVSNARTYRLSMPGVPLKITGADIGRYEREFFAEDFLISPAERVVVEAWFENPGSYTLRHSMPDETVDLARIIVSGDRTAANSYAGEFMALRQNQEVINEFSNFRKYLTREPDKQLRLAINLQGQEIDHSLHAHAPPAPVDNHDTEHAMHTGHTQDDTNPLAGMQWDDPGQTDRDNRTPAIFWQLIDEDTGKVSMEIDDWHFREGDIVKIRLSNDEAADHVMQHPMHIHGQRFVVLSENGVTNNNMVWKDTVMVLPGQTMDILVSMDNPGEWMAHCHIAEHLHAGMMLTFRVEDDTGYAAGDEYRRTIPHHIHH